MACAGSATAGSLGRTRAAAARRCSCGCVFHGGNTATSSSTVFSDDGVITSRLGRHRAQSFPAPGQPRTTFICTWGCWMFDPDLTDPEGPKVGGPPLNQVSLVSPAAAQPGDGQRPVPLWT